MSLNPHREQDPESIAQREIETLKHELADAQREFAEYKRSWATIIDKAVRDRARGTGIAFLLACMGITSVAIGYFATSISTHFLIGLLIGSTLGFIGGIVYFVHRY